MTTPVGTLSDLYLRAEDLANCLYNFPYIDPSSVQSSVRKDAALMTIITTAHKTTIDPNGNTQQTTIEAAERIRLQSEFKTRIYALLERCLVEDPEHGPAFLLYPIVAGFNTRAKNRPMLIAIYERFLPHVEKIEKSTRAYGLIAENIRNIGVGVNQFNKVERHLADFYYGLAKLYFEEKQPTLAKKAYDRSHKLCNKIYSRKKERSVFS